MSEPASISTGIAERYATAIFEIAKENNDLSTVWKPASMIWQQLWADSADLRDLIASPLVSRSEQEAAITAIADKMGLHTILRNTLGLMAEKAPPVCYAATDSPSLRDMPWRMPVAK